MKNGHLLQCAVNVCITNRKCGYGKFVSQQVIKTQIQVYRITRRPHTEQPEFGQPVRGTHARTAV